MTIHTDHHTRRAQRKLDNLAEDFHSEGIKVRLRYTDFGVEVSGQMADVLLAKKELRNRRIEVAK